MADRFSIRYQYCMIRVSFSSTYLSHKRFCEQLEQAARKKPAFGNDPIFRFTHATLMGGVIEWHDCKAIATRMEELAYGELARPNLAIASRLRAAAEGETTFSLI